MRPSRHLPFNFWRQPLRVGGSWWATEAEAILILHREIRSELLIPTLASSSRHQSRLGRSKGNSDFDRFLIYLTKRFCEGLWYVPPRNYFTMNKLEAGTPRFHLLASHCATFCGRWQSTTTAGRQNRRPQEARARSVRTRDNRQPRGYSNGVIWSCNTALEILKPP